jgi:MFS family permease
MSEDRLEKARRPFGGQTLRAFHTRGFRRVWIGGMIWYSARWMEMTVLAWQVLVMTDSAFQVTLVGFFRMAPMFFFGLFSGLVADRFDRRRVILFAQAWSCIMAALIAYLAFTDQLRLWHLAILVTSLGFAWALDMPSRRSFIYDLMGPRKVVNALALDHLGMDGAKMTGPILGGLLLPVIGTEGCFVILAAGYGINFFSFLSLPRPRPRRSVSAGPVLKNLAEGLRYVFRSPVILGVLAITVILNFLGFPYQMLVPVIAKKVLEVGPQLMGLLLAADGFGAMIAALLIASQLEVKYKGRVYVIGSLAMLVSVLLFSFSHWYVPSFLLLLVAGGGMAGFATMQSSLILISASDEMRGRAMGTLILAIGFGPLGTLMVGGLATLMGAPRAVTAIVSVGLVALLLVMWRAPALWRLRSEPRLPGATATKASAG